MSTDVTEAGAGSDDITWPEGPQRRFYGYVIIEWPAPRGKDGIPRAMPGWDCAVFDATTGKPILTVEKLTVPRSVSADAQSCVTCDLVMFADKDGMPVLGPGEDGGFPISKDERGRVRTGVFPFYVAEMRVRQ